MSKAMRNGAAMGRLAMSIFTKQNKEIKKREESIELKQKELEQIRSRLNKK